MATNDAGSDLATVLVNCYDLQLLNHRGRLVLGEQVVPGGPIHHRAAFQLSLSDLEGLAQLITALAARHKATLRP